MKNNIIDNPDNKIYPVINSINKIKEFTLRTNIIFNIDTHLKKDYIAIIAENKQYDDKPTLKIRYHRELCPELPDV